MELWRRSTTTGFLLLHYTPACALDNALLSVSLQRRLCDLLPQLLWRIHRRCQPQVKEGGTDVGIGNW